MVGEDVAQFLDDSISGGAIAVYDATGAAVNMQLRWAKTASGPDTWNLFYQTNSNPAATDPAWLNVGAYGGRADVMSQLAPEGPVYQAGTLSGNPVATTAGLTTLRLATEQVYTHLTTAGDTIKVGVVEALTAAGVPHVVQSNGTMFSVFFRGEPVRNFDDASDQDSSAFAAFFHAMLDAGVHLPPSAYEAWFLSAAHDDRAVQAVLDALPAAARAAAKQGDK